MDSNKNIYIVVGIIALVAIAFFLNNSNLFAGVSYGNLGACVPQPSQSCVDGGITGVQSCINGTWSTCIVPVVNTSCSSGQTISCVSKNTCTGLKTCVAGVYGDCVTTQYKLVDNTCSNQVGSKVVFRKCVDGTVLSTYACVGQASTCTPKPTISLDVNGDGQLEDYMYDGPYSGPTFDRLLPYKTVDGFNIYASSDIANSAVFNIVIQTDAGYVGMKRGGSCSVSTSPTYSIPNNNEVYTSASCIPQTCSSLGKICGLWSDGCVGTLNCGNCEENDGICNWNEPVTSPDCQGNFKIYLPANLQKNVFLYISQDGSTYSDSAMTQLVAGPGNKNPVQATKINAINLMSLNKKDYGFRCLSFAIWSGQELANTQFGNAGYSEFTSVNTLTSKGNLAILVIQGANSLCSVNPQIVTGDYITIKSDAVINTCTPTTCSSLNKTCGVWSNGCSGTLTCGSACSVPMISCSDGIKNQDETAVDCGGVCNACSVVEPSFFDKYKIIIFVVIGLLALLLLTGKRR